MVAGLFLVNADSGGAYPFNMIRTVVINTATAQPILLPQLFTDSTDGLNKLASLVKSSTAAPGGFAPFIDDPARDMANWVPHPKGSLCMRA